jgi:hypothetical protein
MLRRCRGEDDVEEIEVAQDDYTCWVCLLLEFSV